MKKPNLTRYRWRRNRKIGVQFAVFAILLHTIIPFSQAIPSFWNTANQRYMLICTGFGSKFVPLPDELNPAKAKSETLKYRFCPVCQANALSHMAIAPADPGFSHFYQTGFPLPLIIAVSDVPSSPFELALSRGPPKDI